MHIKTIPVGPYEVNCYIVSTTGPEAAVIDPGADAGAILEYLQTRHLTPEAYLLTHGHADHVSALEQLLIVHKIPVLMHADDQRWAFTPRNQIPPFYPALTATPATLRTMTDGEIISIAGIQFKVIATPGHTPGGVCFFAEKEQVLFSGDTLFQGTVGRTDLPGGNGKVLAQSLKKLAQLPPDTRVLPGHGEATTIGAEQRSNIFFRAPASG